LGFDAAVRIHQSVAAKDSVGINRIRTEIAAIGPEGISLLILCEQSLVHPVPDYPPLKGVVFFNHVPVILEISDAVTHGVGIFALDEGALRIGLGIFFHMFNPHVHRAENIGIPVLMGLFILYGPALLYRFEIVVGGVKVHPVAGFVAQRPDDYRRLIFVTFKHVFSTVEMGGLPYRILGQRPAAVTHSVRFDVGLIHHIQTVLVAKLVEEFRLRVMRGADGIDVVGLHQLNVFEHGLLIHHMPVFFMVLMNIRPFQIYILPVDVEPSIFNLAGAETHILL